LLILAIVAPHLGRRLRRVEDPHLITGRGHYASDVRLDGLCHLAVLRSSLPHARIASIDVGAARSMPGVLLVLTADDLPAEAKHLSNWLAPDMKATARPVLARGEVNYVGDAIAAVVAEHEYQAQDAVQSIEVELDPLPAVGDVAAAIAAGAPAVHAGTPDNVASRGEHTYGEVEAAFAGDVVTVKERLSAARICGAAMEPRAATASWHSGDETLTVWDSTQTVFSVRDEIARALGLEKEQVTVLADDVGGGFGPKGTVYAEEVLVALASLRLGRPVTWAATRSEDTATTVHAHGTVFELELAATKDGKLRGLRGRMWHDMGAYASAGVGQPDIIVPHMMSAYVLPAMKIESQVLYTNAAPTGFVRGGGRPLGNFVMERLMDRLAVKLGLDPAEFRRQNLIQPGQMPYDTGFPSGRRTVVYDSGDYPRLLQLALEKIGYEDLRRRQREQRDGRLLGVGLAACVESSGFGSGEPARVHIDTDGTAHLFLGSTPQGQGHLTAASQMLADRLGWPLERIKVSAGDTRIVPWALLTAGSRSGMHVGNATAVAAAAARKKLLELAADVLEADPVDLVLEEGVISVRGVPEKKIAATEVMRHPIEVEESWETKTGTAYSSSCHAAAVSVDPETGSVEVLGYAIAHDTGKVINPMLVESQMQGGFAHGLGYALFEEAIYRPEGEFVSASFLDYTIASPPELSARLELVPVETASPNNPEGIKGSGESATIPAPACIANAVEDALRQVKPDVDIDHIPITPQRLYAILAGAD
jgi:carbon-monoxide dehydrogenase large subunit